MVVVPQFRFLGHVKRQCPFAVGWADNAKLHQLLEFELSNLPFRGINSTLPLDGCGFKCHHEDIRKGSTETKVELEQPLAVGFDVNSADSLKGEATAAPLVICVWYGDGWRT